MPPIGQPAAAPSLVRGTKSSTGQYPLDSWDIEEINQAAAKSAELDREEGTAHLINYIPGEALKSPSVRPYAECETDLVKAGHCLSITCEQWKGIEKTDDGFYFTPLMPERADWRATAYNETLTKSKPPVQQGDRWTKRLSPRGKKAIENSALYMHKIGRGYRTFLTFTFTPEWRAQVEKWDATPRGTDDERKTIGNLITECLNTMQQRHRNGITFKNHWRRAGKKKKGESYTANGTVFKGQVTAWKNSSEWTPIAWREEFKLEGRRRPFNFVWVIENPTNEEGERNPHIHVLMNWHVKIDQFHAWSMWIEKTWGKGFAKLERIRKPSAAAGYMAKAANYISKGAEGEQGPVRGNRYSIGKDARAPKARIIGHYWSERIREAIRLGYESGRKQWPKNLWFHRHGFGATSKKAWGMLWTALKKDGIKLGDPPKGLAAASFSNNAAAYMRRHFNYHKMYIDNFFSEAEDLSSWEPVGLVQ